MGPWENGEGHERRNASLARLRSLGPSRSVGRARPGSPKLEHPPTRADAEFLQWYGIGLDLRRGARREAWNEFTPTFTGDNVYEE